MYTPRDYQADGIKASIEVLTSKRPRKELVVSPTGGGKSLYIAFTAKSVDFPLIVLQPGQELLKQNYSKFVELGGEAEIYSSSMKSFKIGTVTFATIGSIKSKVLELKQLGVKGIIIDEAHLGTQSGSEIRKFIKDVGIKNVLGLTATPIYLKSGIDGAELKMMNRVKGSMFRNIAHVTQIRELVDKGFWTKLIYRSEKQNEAYLQLNSNGSDFTQGSQINFYKENNLESKVARHAQSLRQEGRKSILIFVPSIEEAESLGQLIPGSRVVHNKIKSSERDEIVNKFKALEVDIVINVNILSVGFDHPQLDAIITARSTNSIAIYYQQLGRGVRIFPGKDDCLIIDFSGNYQRFGYVEDLNFEQLPGWGWGMFNKNILLSNYPMEAKIRPTKESLIKSAEVKRKEIFEKLNSEFRDIEIWFGKYKGWKISKIFKENKSYLTWILDNLEFKTENMINLQKNLKQMLNIS